MGLSCLQLNLKKQQETLNKEYDSDVFQTMISSPAQPSYTKVLSNNQHKRFLLTIPGDPQ
jgi:hypothetical protein